MTKFKDSILENFRALGPALSFIITMYIQHVNNTAKINELTGRCTTLEIKIEDQYNKIDAIKLDKAVFEATMTQFTSMRSDIKEMRADIRELLKK